MNKLFYLTITLLLGTVMCSCQNASFIDPSTTIPVSDFWYTGMKGQFGGIIMQHGDQHGGVNPLPTNLNIIVAWEIANDPAGSLYVYGNGTYKKIGKDDYTFDVQLIDTLPKFVLRNMDTTNAIAAGHVFLVNNLIIKDGDTLKHDLDWDNYQILGGMNDVGIIFIKGNPNLLGKPMGASPGFNLFQAKRVNFTTQSVIDFGPIFDPNDIQIQVDDNGRDCKIKTPHWLQ